MVLMKTHVFYGPQAPAEFLYGRSFQTFLCLFNPRGAPGEPGAAPREPQPRGRAPGEYFYIKIYKIILNLW